MRIRIVHLKTNRLSFFNVINIDQCKYHVIYHEIIEVGWAVETQWAQSSIRVHGEIMGYVPNLCATQPGPIFSHLFIGPATQIGMCMGLHLNAMNL